MKCVGYGVVLKARHVAPCVGAWVEIKRLCQEQHVRRRVAPCVGAWVEITVHCQNTELVKSPPAWGRGLKYILCNM